MSDRDGDADRHRRPVTWKDEPEDHDFPAAAAFLSLVMDDSQVTPIVDRLRAATTTHRKAKDILRASALPLLPPDNAHVASDLAKVREGHKLSPVLLVRGSMSAGVPLQIADGYHRVCASYHLDENTDIPCRIVAAG